MYPYYFRQPVSPYNQTSTKILNDMYNLSGLILTIEKNNISLLSNSKVNTAPSFRQYVTQFNAGKYFFFRAQGYLEALVNTKCYSTQSICYFLTTLFYPAYNRFNQALRSFQTFYTGFGTSNAELNRLNGILSEFRRQLNLIMQSTRSYNVKC